MATKSFLSAEDRREADSRLKAPSRPPDGDESKASDFSSLEFSNWLGEKLLARFVKHKDWSQTDAIALGSWARGELSPKSDIDMLFSGDEEAVIKVKNDFAGEGLKLRYRMPEDLNDWRVGVEPFDILALYTAIPLSANARTKWLEQKNRLDQESGDFRKTLVKAMKDERLSREKRFDSISNYLEPNLKYGSGGLRDLEQALVVRTLFPERFAANSEHAFKVLEYYKKFFLLVRQKLHLSEGASDVLTAPEQKPISDWLGYKNPRDFMREIQKGLSRVSFYADWAFEQATSQQAKIKLVDGKKLDSPESLFAALKKDHSILMQNRVRLAADGVFRGIKTGKKALDRKIGKALTEFLDPAKPEGPLVALFRARLIDHCVPEFKKVVGHVQHDQYHRLTVDAHILQAIRELKRIAKHPGLTGKLRGQVKSLNANEWQILSYACLYHDIAKGREGDHSHEGIAIAETDLRKFGKNDAFIKEVTWIVEEHLALSAAAFRENPHSPKTWQQLAEKGVRGRRLALLAVFTIVDIRATNIEAWTPWKERLLFELVSQLERPEANTSINFGLKLKKAKLDPAWLEKLDPFLIASVPVDKLIGDLKALKNGKSTDLANEVVRVRGGQTWVRFHTLKDRPGLFLYYVSLLSGCGFMIRHASVHTDHGVGVYDWFEIKTPKTTSQIKQLLILAEKSVKAAPVNKTSVKFDAIEFVSENEKEWVVSFRGKDQTGALKTAAQALFDQNAMILWAKVHTWGRQIDDIFAITPLSEEKEAFISRLRKSLV